MNRSMQRRAWGIALAGAAAAAAAADVTSSRLESAFYKDFPLFSTHAKETLPIQTIGRFGPVGIGIELLQPPFVMRVKNVEPGSPAEATGRLKSGQIIETINGRKLADIDPRIQLGNVITAAEATDGKVRLVVREKPEAPPEEVVVEIPVLGAYSKTWPLNCPKSDRIVRNMADYLAQSKNNGMGLGLLFLLSTGDARDLEVAREWVREIVEKDKGQEQVKTYPWYAGYGGIGLCEYYLRTGDETILPHIGKLADCLKRTMFNGGWCQKGEMNFTYGHLNAAGVPSCTFLLLAKECGAAVDDHTLKTSFEHFFRFAGHGNVAYGDALPETQFVDNGKTGKLAFTMAAAATLTPEGEKSIYAKARDVSAIKGFYSTSWMLHGHTGGGIGEIWRSAAMGLMADKKPVKYREFMDNRMWHYEMSRRFDGSFTILGGERYDEPGWGIGYAMTYTIPRKTLRLTGAPPTKYCKTYPLPERPWGTAADEAFYSLEAAPDPSGRRQEVDAEKLATDASWPILRRVNDPAVTDDVLLMYARHPDHGVREMATFAIAKLGRERLIPQLLRDKDPRARHAGTMAVAGTAPRKGEADDRLTDEIVGLLVGIVDDPAESWWVARNALVILGRARPELLAPHADRLCEWLRHDDWWLHTAALTAVSGLAVDPRFAGKIWPIIGHRIVANRNLVAMRPVAGIVARLKDAPPEVQALAVQTLAKAYADFPQKIVEPGGTDMAGAVTTLVVEQAQNLANAPGGLDLLYRVATRRFPGRKLPHHELFLAADATALGPDLRKTVESLIVTETMPEYIGAANHIASNRKLLLDETSSATPFSENMYYGEPRVDYLVRLYGQMGNHDYDWHVFGPDLAAIDWDYLTFDPPETRLWAPGTRFRPVTVPAGMENWFAVEFDPRKAGWKTGRAPFGVADGRLVTDPPPCAFPFCRCDEPMQTLWDKEVLLVRTKLKLPPFKEGHRYRLLVAGMSHVGRGEGYRVYVNGRQLMERDRGVGKREGGRPLCYYIDKSWWPDFAGEVTIAAMGFLPSDKRQHFGIFLQEMKNPPFGEAEILDSARKVPMKSSAWQELQDPAATDADPAQGLLRWDGSFVANPAVLGTWKFVGAVRSIEEYVPGKPLPASKSRLERIALRDGGKTDDLLWIWTGDTLMDLNTNQALKMVVKKVGDEDRLFVEEGGFDALRPKGWKSMWYVLERAPQ